MSSSQIGLNNFSNLALTSFKVTIKIMGFTEALIGITTTGIHERKEIGIGYPNKENEIASDDGSQQRTFVKVITIIFKDIAEPFLLLAPEICF